jgi:hypothetical protein
MNYCRIAPFEVDQAPGGSGGELSSESSPASISLIYVAA